MKLFSFSRITQKTKDVFCRFPMAIVSAIIGTGIGIMIINDFGESKQMLFNILMTLTLGFLLFISVQLFSEREVGSKIKKWLLKGGVMVFLMIYYILLPEQITGVFIVRFILFSISFLLSITFAPFVLRNEINGFWQHNKSLFIRFFFTGIYTGVLYLGLVLALASIDNLLGIDIADDTYFELWVFIIGIIATTFFLAGIPLKTEKLQKEKDYPKGIKIFGEYILMPLIAIYFVILYIYSGKILFLKDWPEGMVTYLILVFSFVGIIAYFLLYPIRKDHKLIKWFSKWVYMAIIPLTGVLFWAIKLRIDEYGLTERRYYVVVIGVWLLAMSIYFLFSKKQDIKVLAMSLFLIALLSSFGPWGALDMSAKTQINRLKSVLIKNDILIDGKIVKAKKEISLKDNGQISGALDYLEAMHGFNRIENWFDEDIDEILNNDKYSDCYNSACKIANKIGVEYSSRWERKSEERHKPDKRNYFHFNTNELEVRDISGYNYLVDFSFQKDSFDEFRINDIRYSIGIENKKVTFKNLEENKIINQADIQNEIKLLIEEYKNKNSNNISSENMRFNKNDLDLSLLSIGINKEGDDVEIDFMRGYLLLKDEKISS